MAEAANTISDYIWCYYQTVRPYSFNDYLTPLEKEKRYFNQNLLLGVLNQLTTTHKGGLWNVPVLLWIDYSYLFKPINEL